MTSEQWAEVIKTLGVSGPLVGILIYLLKQATEERRAITKDFLATLTTTVSSNAQAQTRAAESLQDLAGALRDTAKSSADEHNRIVDAIGKLGRRES